jgi:sugar/nucleoside kinase (ribokinase family)
MSDAQLDVMAAGHLCLDMTPQFGAATGQSFGEIMKPGTLVLMEGMTFSTGGAVSNTGIAMKIFGLGVGFVAKVGDDAIGKIIIDLLRARGNPAGIKVAPGAASSYSVVLAPPGIDRLFLHCPGTNDTFTSDDIDYRLVEQARLFHFGYPTLMRNMYLNDGEDLARLFQKAKQTGVTTSLDISLPDPNSPAGRADWRTILGRALPSVDIFVPSIEEAFFMLRPDAYRERRRAAAAADFIDHVTTDEYSVLADQYLALGCKVVVLKAGHHGWFLKTADAQAMGAMGKAAPADPAGWGGRELWCPAFVAREIASATGAGDASIAAFLTALVRGRGIEESLKLANCAGWLNLRAIDALSGLTSWQEVVETYPTLDVRDNAFLGEAGWAWNEAAKLWEK